MKLPFGCGSKAMGSHFGVGAPSTFSGVHWGHGLLTHGLFGEAGLPVSDPCDKGSQLQHSFCKSILRDSIRSASEAGSTTIAS